MLYARTTCKGWVTSDVMLSLSKHETADRTFSMPRRFGCRLPPRSRPATP
ncbi:MAG: hypothetical protein AMXMBFR76_25940 [Pseudomonadota bacterium]